MSDYSKTTNFSAKDALPTGDPDKVVLGADHDTEYDNIATAITTKANKVASATANNILAMDSSGDLIDGAIQVNDIYKVGGTDVPITDGGTGASNASDARTNLGLGTMAVENTVANAKLDGYPWAITDMEDTTAGNCHIGLWAGDLYTSPGTSSYTPVEVVLTKTILRAGTYRTRLYLSSSSVTKNVSGAIYKNGVQVGTTRTTTSGSGVYASWTQDLAFSAGDIISVKVGAQDTASCYSYLGLSVGNPMSEVCMPIETPA